METDGPEANVSPIVPPSSAQTSNHLTEGLDFVSDAGGKCGEEMRDGGDGDLEEGEIESETEISEQESKPTPADEEKSGQHDELHEGKDVHRKNDNSSSCAAVKRPHIVMEESMDVDDEHSDDEVPAKFLRADSSSGDLKARMGGTQEFEIIDDLGPDVEGDNDLDDSCNSDDDLDDGEIHAWLEEGVNRRPPAEDGHIQREKVILQEKGLDPFEVLPEGWVVITHNSGMPVYLHKQSRVCTLSRPYFLGPGSVRKHDIPLSAIPCLQYRRELDKETNSSTQQFKGSEMNGECLSEAPVELPPCNGDPNDTAAEPQTNEDGTLKVPPVKIEYAEERKKQNSLDPLELRDYCEKLFEFRTITVKKFKTWKDRRRHLNMIKKLSRPALPSNIKLITCSIPQDKGEDKPKRKEFILNPAGKSFVCILHEYAQHTLKVQPHYVYRELENAQNPYSATVVISEVEYGTGYSSSKKSAKMAAAKETLKILIPEMNKVTDDKLDEEDLDLSFFDEIKIEDPRVYELCNKAGQHSPYQILQECLRRNYGMGDTNCKIEVKSLKHQKSEYSLTVGKRTVTVVCKNKREGKQRAAQAILQELHPHITCLGSLLRLYGRSSWKSVKEKKREEHSITELQSQACSKKPNTAVLEKLKEEMKKLHNMKKAIKSKGTLTVDSSTLPGHVASLDL